jgi:uncharacterized membrane protein YdjX (TVP38/TMEM64 family)/DNA-directed RNA polymerase subunit RPC12/RpoP
VLIIVFWKDVAYVAEQLFGGGGGDASVLREFFRGRGFLGVLLIFLLQIIFIVSIVIPTELLQVVAGVAYGPWYGTLICVIGVVAASMIVFAVARRTKGLIQIKKLKAKREEIGEMIKHSNKSAFAAVSLMAAVPVFTFGIVAIVAAMSTRLKWWQFLIISVISSVISTFVAVFFGNILVRVNPAAATALVISIFIAAMIFMLAKTKILKLVFRQRKSIDKKLDEYKPRKQSRFIPRAALPHIRRKYIKRRNVEIFDLCGIKEMKPPFMILCNHPSWSDWIYACYSIRPHKAYTILNRWYFHNKLLWWVLPRVGGIPKKLFTPEITPIKNMLSAVKNNGVVQLFPEGINTCYGAGSPIIPATAALVKKLKIPVVSIVINGAFLTLPKWSYEENIGKIHVTIDNLFSAEQAGNLSEKEILERISERLKFDDYKWARENKVVYKGETRAKNMHFVFYLCPICKSEFKMRAEGNIISCEECNSGVFVDNSFRLKRLIDTKAFPADIPEWYRLQELAVAQEVKNEEFELRQKCTVRSFDSGRGFKVIPAYQGEVVLKHEGVRFNGTCLITGESKEIFQERAKLPAVSTTTGKSFDFYLGDNWYEFVLEDGIQTIKYALAIRAIGEYYGNGKDGKI